MCVIIFSFKDCFDSLSLECVSWQRSKLTSQLEMMEHFTPLWQVWAGQTPLTAGYDMCVITK